MRLNFALTMSALVSIGHGDAFAEVIDYAGPPDALPHERFVNVVDEEISPVIETYIESADGVYVAAAIRKPPGVSLGGNLVLYLASKIPGLKAVVAGAPAPFWFLAVQNRQGLGAGDGNPLQIDTAIVTQNIAPIRTPVLIQVGTADPLLAIDRVLHEQLESQSKAVRMEIYEHGYHDFVLGPQGHNRPDLPEGEILLQGTLDALARSVAFVKSGRL